MNNFSLRMLATIVCVVFLVASALAELSQARADDSPFYFDESGRVQQHGYWSPTNRHAVGAEEDRRQYNAWSNAEALRKNREMIDEYHAPKPVAPPSGPSSYWIYPGPGEPARFCQPSFGQVICN
ncbi:MAG: hypothetical protein KF693_05135 [Nitrospira sp.]|nr:hypothetical protein [Nitrospira sp.]